MFKNLETAPRASYENRGEVIEVQIVQRVSEYLLASILSTAIEGGINYWCGKVRLTKEPVGFTKDESEVWNEWICRALVLGGEWTVWDAENENEKHILTREKLIAGFQLYLTKYGHRVRIQQDEDGTLDFDYDANDADLVFQLALFGEVVYG